MRASVAILQSDTRPPSLVLASSPPHVAYQSLTVYLNKRYAKRHGYAFLYYQLSEPHGCAHATWGPRHPSYCKLPPLALALQRFSLVAVIDSDSWFSPSAPPLPALLPKADASAPLATVHFAADMPFSHGPNCGFMGCRASPAAA